MSDNAFSADNQQGSRPALSGIDPSETTRRIPHMNKELVMLLGLLFTDGCVSPKWKHSWRIYFSNKSETLIQLFRNCMIKSFELESSRMLMGKTSNGFPKAVVNSKEIGNWLVSTFGTFRTLKFADGSVPQAKLPVSFLITSGYAKEFLQTAFSCDGGISFYPAYTRIERGQKRFLIRTIFLSCAHTKLRSEYIRLLAALGVEARDVAGDGKVKIENRENIEKFYRHVGFLENIEITDHSKFWRKRTKQEILKMLVDSYSEPKIIYDLPQFMRGNDIVRTS